MTIHKVTTTEEALALMIRAFQELNACMATIESRHGTEFARGVMLALAVSTALPEGVPEPLDARLVCSTLCKRFGFLDPFPEALAEGRALEGGWQA